MNQQELKTALELHRKWVLNEDGGSRANLAGANLTGANLTGANLAGAYLTGAYLTRANLTDAYLTGANLTRANLTDAYLTRANLTRAYLARANLAGANLTRANLTRANLTDAYLTSIKEDFFKVLTIAKAESFGLYDALQRGLIDGSQYQGECACLVGTIANLRHENYTQLGIDLRPAADRPAERWFLAIRKGDIPQSNPVSAVTAEWMREFMTANAIKYPRYEIVAMAE